MMRVSLTDKAIIFKTKIFESRTKNKDKIYIKYRCSIPAAISNYLLSDDMPEEDKKQLSIYLYPTEDPEKYLIKIGTPAAITDAAGGIKRKIYLSGSKERHHVYNFLIPNKLIKDKAYHYAIFTVLNDRTIFLSYC